MLLSDLLISKIHGIGNFNNNQSTYNINRFDFLTIIIADAQIFLYTFYFSDEEISFVVPLILRSLRLGKIIKLLC